MNEIRKFPAETVRVESGPIQFGDDWPGVFFRGDNALADASMLAEALKRMPDDAAPQISSATAKELADSCFSMAHPSEGASYPSVLAAIERALSIDVAQGSPDRFIVRAVIEGLINNLRSCSVGDTGWPPG